MPNPKATPASHPPEIGDPGAPDLGLRVKGPSDPQIADLRVEGFHLKEVRVLTRVEGTCESGGYLPTGGEGVCEGGRFPPTRVEGCHEG